MRCPNCQASRMRITKEGYYCLNCDYHVDAEDVPEPEQPVKN